MEKYSVEQSKCFHRFLNSQMRSLSQLCRIIAIVCQVETRIPLYPTNRLPPSSGVDVQPRTTRLNLVNWLIPTLQSVYPAGRNTLPAHKRECFPPISDSSAPTLTLTLLSVVPHKNLFASGKVDYSAERSYLYVHAQRRQSKCGGSFRKCKN